MPIAYNDVAHLLRRAGFGGTPNEISSLSLLTLAQVVDRLLDTSTAPAVTYPSNVTDTSLASWQRGSNFSIWWVDRMATTTSPLIEKMILFWHMHFTSSLDKSEFPALWNQNKTFRTLGLGSFETLAQAVAIDAAMLDYLDNASNVKGKPNENFARESMELFTLGLNQYTQADVTQVAKAWTGHGLTNAAYVFTANKHDATDKTIFGVTRNWNGPEVITDIVNGSKQAVCARFIANKLWAFFAYPSPSSSLLDALQVAFISSGMNISALLRTIFLRPEFYSVEAKQGRVRNPIEFIAAAEKSTGIMGLDGAHPEWYSEPMGMRIFYPPNVAGWTNNAGWISASSMWAKGRFARNLCWTAANRGILAGSSTLSVATAVQRAFDQFGINEPSSSTRSAMEQMVTAERTARGWAEQVNLITLAMLTPEFQMA